MKTEQKITGMTPEALAALDNAGLSRRGFLRGAGAMIVTFGAAGSVTKLAADDHHVIQRLAPLNQVDSWVAILRDENVHIFSGKCEFGQGFKTVQQQLAAEELGVSLRKVWVNVCDTFFTPDQGVTSGSQSHPAEFGVGGLRDALVTAREALLQMAAQRFSVGVDRLTVTDGVISVIGDATRTVTYGQLIGERRFNLTLNPNPKHKHPKDYTVLGTSVPRDDVPAKVLGTYRYVQTVRLPGMLHGKVVRPPAIGAKVVRINEASISGLPGNVKVVRRVDFVGVVADTEWQALQASQRLEVEWTKPAALPKQSEFYDWMRQQPTRDSFTVLTPDVEDKMKAATRVISATYRHPYQMHGSLASSCAVADFSGTGANMRGVIYSATQGVYPLRDSTANLLGIPRENIRVIFAEGSGCYGCNGNDTVSMDAALMSVAVGKPVRVQFTRKDEMAGVGENFGPAYVIDLKAGLDANGTISVWSHEAFTLAKGGRPNANTPANIVTGELAGLVTPPIVPARGVVPTAFNNGGNSASSYSGGFVAGQSRGTGKIMSESTLVRTVQSPFFTGPLRSPARLQNTFAHESFIDEVAAALRLDPVQYRLRHLSDNRLIDVLTGAATAFKWETRPSPKPGNARTGLVRGQGIAIVLYEGDNGYCGLAVEVEVNQATGAVRVVRGNVSNDSGPISNPDGIRNQVEGGVLQGMSRALYEEVTWDDQGITSNDWRRYPVHQFGDPLPTLDSVLINRLDEEHMGAGETTITIAAAAIANAIFDATGARIRQVPFTPDRVLAALRARA